MPFCSNCGTQVDANSNACGSCGTTVGGDQISVGVMAILGTSLKFVMKKPFRLWGLSLLFVLLIYLTLVSTFALPLLTYAIIYVLQLGMTAIFLDGYRGKEVSASQLFSGFSSKFFRNAGGMGWKDLWITIWALVPCVGLFFAIAKGYAYRFVPYILNNEPEIGALDALKKSIQQTKGYRLKMFLADLLIGVFLAAAFLILGIFCLIPYIRYLFFIILALFTICVSALLPLYMGIVSAAFYDKITKK